MADTRRVSLVEIASKMPPASHWSRHGGCFLPERKNRRKHLDKSMRLDLLSQGEFYCDVCGKDCSSSNYHSLHARLDHCAHLDNSGEFCCDVCGKDCSSHNYLSLHARQDHGAYLDNSGEFCCDVCGKDCSSHNYLSLHSRQDHGAYLDNSGEFCCDVCGKDCSSSQLPQSSRSAGPRCLSQQFSRVLL